MAVLCDSVRDATCSGGFENDLCALKLSYLLSLPLVHFSIVCILLSRTLKLILGFGRFG
jgi:hypothetical protein